MKGKNIIAVLLAVIISGSAFFLAALLMLPTVWGDKAEPSPAGDSITGEAYYTPENANLLLLCFDGSGALLRLLFDEGKITCEVYDNHAEEQGRAYSGGDYYTLFADADFIAAFADRIGGVELSEGSAKRRYFSAGIRQKLAERTDYAGRCELVSAFFEKIAKIGLSSGDFKFIIEETENDLVYPVCYGWIDKIGAMAENFTVERRGNR